jgi:ubiquinone/menaquinone biosynthesis C-methylase UbiE
LSSITHTKPATSAAAAGLGPGHLALDAGCGAGRVTRELLKAVAPSGYVFALDLSARMVARARAALPPGVIYACAPVEQMPLPEASLDAVFCYNCFHLFACHRLALTEFRRALKPGGRLVIMHSEPMEKVYAPAMAISSRGQGRPLAPADLVLLVVRRGFFLLKAPRRTSQVLVAAVKS